MLTCGNFEALYSRKQEWVVRMLRYGVAYLAMIPGLGTKIRIWKHLDD